MKFLATLLLIGFLTFAQLKAQEGTQYNQQLWLEAMVDNHFGVKWDLFTDASYRQVFKDEVNFWQLMVRPSIKFQAWKWLDFRGGLGAFYTHLDKDLATLEIRPWEGVAIGWPKIKGIKFVHLFRLEQRIIYDVSDWSSTYSDRFRYQLSTRINLNRKRKYKIFFIPLAVEFFFQPNNELNELFRSRTRFTIGLGYVVNREVTIDAKLVAESNRSDDLNLNVTDLIFRLRFRYNLFSFEEDETKL